MPKTEKQDIPFGDADAEHDVIATITLNGSS
jgi:hypothetical protein